MMFSSCSSLEQIGSWCFAHSGIEDVSIPDGVRELCNRCFRRCWSLRRVEFGSSSSLERIGVGCFSGSGVEEVSIEGEGKPEVGEWDDMELPNFCVDLGSCCWSSVYSVAN